MPSRGMASARHHHRVFGRIRQRCAEHQPVLQRMSERILDISPSHLRQFIACALMRLLIQKVRERLEGAPDDLSQDMIAAGEMFVRRLVRYTQPPRHLTQAQAFHALTLDDRQRLLNAGFTEIAAFL
jgi:hypothetical protein